MSQHKIQFKIQPGQLRAEEKTETKQAEMGFFLVNPGEKLNTAKKDMPRTKLKVQVGKFKLKCSYHHRQRLEGMKPDGIVRLRMDRFSVWKDSDVSQLLARVDKSVISQAFAQMAKKMSGDSSDDVPETAVDLLHPDQQLGTHQETQARAIFWIKDKEETKRIETVQDPDDIFFNVGGVDHIPHCNKVEVVVDGLTIIARNATKTTAYYDPSDKKLWVISFGWYTQHKFIRPEHFAQLHKDFSNETIRQAYRILAEKLIEHDEKKRTGGKRKNVPPTDVEEWTLEGIEEEHLQKRVKGMRIDSSDASETH